MNNTAWVLEKVEAHRPAAGVSTWPTLDRLVAAAKAVRGTSQAGQLFGLGLASVEREGLPRLDAAIRAALVEWKSRLDAENDVGSLLDLDKVGRALELSELRLTRRFPLRCDPLGTRDGLAIEWLRRLEKLDEAIAGRRALDASAVHMSAGAAPIFFAPDEAALYEHALRHETMQRQMFPRELAALVMTADGISFGDDALVLPLREWRDEDHGVCIGAGSTSQGSFTIMVTSKRGLLDAKVIDRDDDGTILARYASLGAFFDALLGG